MCVGFLPTFATGNSVGKGFGEARDLGGIFADASRFRTAETALSRVSGAKAAESYRLFRQPHESGFARDWVVGLVGLKLTTNRLWTQQREPE